MGGNLFGSLFPPVMYYYYTSILGILLFRYLFHSLFYSLSNLSYRLRQKLVYKVFGTDSYIEPIL